MFWGHWLTLTKKIKLHHIQICTSFENSYGLMKSNSYYRILRTLSENTNLKIHVSRSFERAPIYKCNLDITKISTSSCLTNLVIGVCMPFWNNPISWTSPQNFKLVIELAHAHGLASLFHTTRRATWWVHQPHSGTNTLAKPAIIVYYLLTNWATKALWHLDAIGIPCSKWCESCLGS